MLATSKDKLDINTLGMQNGAFTIIQPFSILFQHSKKGRITCKAYVYCNNSKEKGNSFNKLTLL